MLELSADEMRMPPTATLDCFGDGDLGDGGLAEDALRVASPPYYGLGTYVHISSWVLRDFLHPPALG